MRITLSSNENASGLQVSGGEHGSPFRIGGYGIYAQSQFDIQFKQLKDFEVKNSVGSHFLSSEEWCVVDKGLRQIAHFGDQRFSKACRGDTYLALAIRKKAFVVAGALLGYGLLILSYKTKMHFNPELSQLNPKLSQLNPNLSQLHPNLTQLNLDLSQLNPNLTQFKPDLSQLHPDLVTT